MCYIRGLIHGIGRGVPNDAAGCSFVLLEVTCSPRGLAVHMQIFET